MRITSYILSFFILLSSCAEKKEEVVKKEYAIISGIIKNSFQDHFMIIGKHINHTINLNQDGSFLDTLAIKIETTNGFKINNKQIPIYIKNGYHIKLNVDVLNFPNSIKYSGSGTKENTYLLAQYQYGLKAGNADDNGLLSLEEGEFLKKIKEYKKGLDSIDNVFKNIDLNLLELTKKQNIKALGLIKNLYNTTKDGYKKQKEVLKKLVKGTTSPVFNNYENPEGKLISLTDFKGNFVYIDVWGTWIKKYTDNAKILNDFKKKYADKNIKFITLCADNMASSGTITFAKQKWKNAIKENNLIGNHLFIGNDREFLKEYLVLDLPRYILIDPKGKIVNAKAPAPYDTEITTLFNTLKLK